MASNHAHLRNDLREYNNIRLIPYYPLTLRTISSNLPKSWFLCKWARTDVKIIWVLHYLGYFRETTSPKLTAMGKWWRMQGSCQARSGSSSSSWRHSPSREVWVTASESPGSRCLGWGDTHHPARAAACCRSHPAARPGSWWIWWCCHWSRLFQNWLASVTSFVEGKQKKS